MSENAIESQESTLEQESSSANVTQPKNDFKKDICIDFDGVIHSYTSGWKGIDQIPDPPVPGAFESLMKYIDYGYHVCIYSSRSKDIKGVMAMTKWFIEHGFPERKYLENLSFPTQKPSAWVTIDDRCICFNGGFPTTDEIDNFKPWFKKPAGEQPRPFDPLMHYTAEEVDVIKDHANDTMLDIMMRAIRDGRPMSFTDPRVTEIVRLAQVGSQRRRDNTREQNTGIVNPPDDRLLNG